MAITKTMHMKASAKGKIDIHLEHALKYIMQPKKLGKDNLVGGVNCLPEMAYEQMKATKQMFGKNGGRQGYHFVISLKPGEGTPEIMYNIAMRYVEEAFNGEYEAVVAVHTDREHLHAHIIINSVNMVTGYKFQYRDGDWKYKYQPITNKLCEEYGLHITPAAYSEEPKNVARPEWEYEKDMCALIKEHVNFCTMQAESMPHFLYLLKSLGYEVKDGAHIEVKADGMKRFRRLDTLDENFTKENLDILIKYSEPGQAYYHKTSNVGYILSSHRRLTPIQRRCYTRIYRRYKAEKQPFLYHSAALQKQIKIMQQLQEEYNFLYKYDVKDMDELLTIHQQIDDEIVSLTEQQDKLYKVRYSQKRKCKTEAELEAYDETEDYYRNELERIKSRKKELRQEKKVAARCIYREMNRSELLREDRLEELVPVGDMSENLDEQNEWIVPENPSVDISTDRRDDNEDIEEKTIDVADEDMWTEAMSTGLDVDIDTVGEKVDTMDDLAIYYADKSTHTDKQTDMNADGIYDYYAVDVVEASAVGKEIEAIFDEKLPNNKADYMKLDDSRKAELFYKNGYFDGSDAYGTKIMNYLKSISYSDSSGDIIDEAMNVQNVYGQMEKELFVKAELDRISDRLAARGLVYSDMADMTIAEQAQVLRVGNLTYSDGMSVYRKVLEKAGVKKEFDEIYQDFDRIYEESGRLQDKEEKKWEKRR